MMGFLRKVPPLIWALLAFEVLLVVGYIGSHWMVALFDHPKRLAHFLNLDAEANLPTWFSCMQHAAVAVLFGLFIIRQKQSFRWPAVLMWLLPVLFLLFSLDELTECHEWMGNYADALVSPENAQAGVEKARLGTWFPKTGISTLVLGVPLILFLIPFLNMIHQQFAGHPTAFTKLVVGFVVFLSGAIGAELLYNWALQTPDVHYIQVALEEFLEMAGVTLALWSPYELLTATPAPDITSRQADPKSAPPANAALA